MDFIVILWVVNAFTKMKPSSILRNTGRVFGISFGIVGFVAVVFGIVFETVF